MSRQTTLFSGFVKPEPFFNKLAINCLSSDSKDAGYYEMIRVLWVFGKGHGLSEGGFVEEDTRTVDLPIQENEPERKSIILKAQEKQQPKDQPHQGLPSFVHVSPQAMRSLTTNRGRRVFLTTNCGRECFFSSLENVYDMQCCFVMGG